jgi:hypothetical protein
MFGNFVEQIRQMQAAEKAKAEADQVARYNLWKKPAETPSTIDTPTIPWDARKEAGEINARRATLDVTSGGRGLISRNLTGRG